MKSNLPERLKRALPFLIITIGVYTALPFAAIATGSGTVYVIGVPLLDCCIVSAIGFFYGKSNGRDPLMPLCSALLFLPIMFIFYNFSAWIYLILLPIFCYFGQCMGNLYRKR